MRYVLAAAALAALAACSPPSAPTTSTSETPAAAPAQEAEAQPDVPAGAYTLDKAHASLLVRLDHLGFSHFTARFEHWDAQLALDPANPSASTLSVSIDPRSVASDNPPAGFINIMRGSQFLDTAQFQEVAFHSTQIERTGANTARIIGDLTLHGVTKPVTLEATLNGGYPGMQLDPHARVGFSAHGSFKRSDFAMGFGVPPAGSNMGVGDTVEIIVESEFSGPAWTPPQNPAP